MRIPVPFVAAARAPPAARAVHTTTVSLATRRSKRKAELAAQRAAEVETKRRAEERLRQLKDTAFLNSLERPDRLFQSTQITQQDRAISMGTASSEGPATGSGTGSSVKRLADSGKYACSVRPSEIQLITHVAPKALAAADNTYSNYLVSDMASGNPTVQSDIVRRIVALENSSAKGVVQYNTRMAVAAFGRSAGDSGSPEVQAAVWTVRINQLEDHLRAHRKDHQNRRAYTMLLHKRAKMLKYLRRESLERYYMCLKQLGLAKEMVEGEIVTPKRIE
ncbi:hypothetical protein IWQ56_002901 [Coemansia nantahalensis]|uniref:Uncharacterized protein n=2 Tax=Coemansia TaxID=4863 RepID=A0ACC1LAP4_9FUNG|nr:hypothetical protein IWQ56_002901 [Coemansia nantahalensis]KAJ2768994.1 hypothetical protein IWQ57_003299 [Coemansia nantahalensis]KAJ2804804.1 hypothetical protein H4R21_001500 [Coemansia helicoidea]